MSMTLTVPDAKTMALGAVATGNMKASDEVMATGTMKNNGLTSMDRALKEHFTTKFTQ